MAISNEYAAPEFQKYQNKLDKTLDRLRGELSAIRAGRANPKVLDKITVDYWGTPTSLTQMANISVPEPRMLVISPYDASAIKEINKAIAASDLGIHPSDDGKIIRLVFPQLNEERRKELCKQVKKLVDDFKITLRNERRDVVEAVKKLKKESLVTEDEIILYEKEAQKLLDAAVAVCDKLLKEKEAEILEI